MSVYDNYKIINNNDLLFITQDNKNIFEFSSNSNSSYSKLKVPSIGFNNTNYGINFNSSTNKINFSSLGVSFDSDIEISGNLTLLWKKINISNHSYKNI